MILAEAPPVITYDDNEPEPTAASQGTNVPGIQVPQAERTREFSQADVQAVEQRQEASPNVLRQPEQRMVDGYKQYLKLSDKEKDEGFRRARPERRKELRQFRNWENLMRAGANSAFDSFAKDMGFILKSHDVESLLQTKDPISIRPEKVAQLLRVFGVGALARIFEEGDGETKATELFQNVDLKLRAMPGFDADGHIQKKNLVRDRQLALLNDPSSRWQSDENDGPRQQLRRFYKLNERKLKDFFAKWLEQDEQKQLRNSPEQKMKIPESAVNKALLNEMRQKYAQGNRIELRDFARLSETDKLVVRRWEGSARKQYDKLQQRGRERLAKNEQYTNKFIEVAWGTNGHINVAEMRKMLDTHIPQGGRLPRFDRDKLEEVQALFEFAAKYRPIGITEGAQTMRVAQLKGGLEAAYRNNMARFQTEDLKNQFADTILWFFNAYQSRYEQFRQKFSL